MRNADQAQQLDGPRARLRLGHRLVGLNHLHDLPPDAIQRMETRERILEDHRDAAAAHGPQLVGRHRQQILPLEERLARHPCAPRQPHHRLRGDALAGSRFADDAEHLAASNGERETADRLEDAVGRPERHAEVADVEQRRDAGVRGTGVIAIRLMPAGRRRATATRDRSSGPRAPTCSCARGATARTGFVPRSAARTRRRPSDAARRRPTPARPRPHLAAVVARSIASSTAEFW